MNLSKLVIEWGDRFKNTDLSIDSNRQLAIRKINEGWKRVYNAYFWEYRKKVGELVIPPMYTTGTVTVTQFDGTNESAARTVTFSTPLTDSHIGRFFQVEGSSNWHRILGISGSNAYLESPVVDVNGSGKTFKVWKRFNYLYSEVDTLLEFGKWYPVQSLSYKSPSTTFDLNESEINAYSEFGADNFITPYSTGSVSIAVDSNIMIGDGTAWLGNVTPGDIVEIGENEFRVRRVETDTKIVLYNYSPSAVESGATYKISKDNPIGFEFYNPDTTYMVLPYSYICKGFNMVHETLDRPGLPEQFDNVIVDYAEALRVPDNDDPKWISKIQVAQSKLDGLKAKHRVVMPPFQQFKTRIPARITR